MRLSRAIDLFDVKLSESCAKTTRAKYVNEILIPFADSLDPEATVDETSRDDCRLFLGRWRNASPSTYNLGHTVLNVFYEFCIDEGWRTERNPMHGIGRRKRERPEDLAVPSLEDNEVGRLYAACQELDELLTIAILAYTGVRRTAAANLRWRDLDFVKGTGRFEEKGGKTNVLPLPDELREMLYAIGLEGQVPCAPDDYVIPNRAPGLVGGGMPAADRHVVRYYANKNPKRNNKVVYNNVKRVVKRAGLGEGRGTPHPHTLRAAFAVHFYEQPDEHGEPRRDLLATKDLLGHSRVETTEVYLRRRQKERAKANVRGLSWASVFQPSMGMPPAGFEPALGESALPDPLRLKLEELRAAQSRRKQRDRRR